MRLYSRPAQILYHSDLFHSLISEVFHCFFHSQGGKTGAVQKCVACRGRGMRIIIRQLGPGMVQQMQSVCTDCNGEGKTADC